MMLSYLLRICSIKQYPEFDTAFQNALMSIKEFLDANKIDETIFWERFKSMRKKEKPFVLFT